MEQLGSGSVDVRLGRLYALERLTKDSPPDQSTIIDVVSAFVRVHAPTASGPCTAPLTFQSIGGLAHPQNTLQPDVEAALVILSRRNKQEDNPGRETTDLHGTCLRGSIVLARKVLSDYDLSGSDLSLITLAYAQAERRVYLTGSSLLFANLTGVYAPSAYFLGSDMRNANLSGATLPKAFFGGATMSGATLSGTRLMAADFTRTNLSDSNLETADLEKATLRYADVSRSDFYDADLTGADFTGANVAGADFRMARGVDLDGAIGRPAHLPS